MDVKYIVGDRQIVLELNGEVISGLDNTLLLEDINLLEGTPWNETGFTIQPFLSDADFKTIKEGITSEIRNIIHRVGGKTDDSFTLERYHCYVNENEHLEISRLIQHGWNVAEFPVDFSIVETRISDIIGKKVSALARHLNPDNFKTGLSDKNYASMYVFNVRIVRPNKFQDNNPPHRDVWIDRLRNAVNIYAPLCGSTEHSSLPLVPRSHYFKESDIERTAEGAFLNGIKYSVPCVTKIKGKPPELQRPQVIENEVMIFSPYLVHGGAYNFETDKTRMSLETRFWAQ